MSIKWTRTGIGSWQADVNGRTLFVHRTVVQRSHVIDTGFISIGAKPRHRTSTTLVHATVLIGNTYHRLGYSSSVKAAKTVAEVYTLHNVGKVDCVENLDN